MQGKSFGPSIAVMGRDDVGRSKSSPYAVKQAYTLGFKRVIFEGDAWKLECRGTFQEQRVFPLLL